MNREEILREIERLKALPTPGPFAANIKYKRIKELREKLK